MKKALAILALALLAGCASVPMSSVQDGARPSHRIDNGDGTATFEFVFPYDNTWDRNMAMQRINEYLTTYARLNGFSGYATISAAVQLLSKVSGASAALDILANAAGGASGDTSPPAQAKFVRVIEQVKFRT
jgi:hypothetical protein